MPGTNLNLVLPSLSDNLATIVSKTAQALSTIQNDLAPKISAGILNINSTLPFNGNAATGLGSIQLVTGNTPTAAGSLYYLNGEFYAIDATGVIQLTLNGALNAAGIGGIVGDYGGVNPARETYVAASGQYQFTSSPGVWADLVAAHLILEGASGTVKLGVDNAISGATIANFKSFPTSGVSFVVFNAATSTFEDGGVTQVSNPLVSTNSIKASALKFTTSIQLNIPTGQGVITSSGSSGPTLTKDGTYNSPKQWQFDTSGVETISFPVKLPAGAKIGGYGFQVNKTSTSTVHMYGVLVAQDNNGNITNADSGNAVGPSSAWGIDYSANNPGHVAMTPSGAASVATTDANHEYHLVIQNGGGASGDVVMYAFVTYTVL